MRSILVIVVAVFFALTLSAQPSWMKKASKSVFVLKTFSEDGTLKGSSFGFFVGSKGEALSSYTPFRGADRAVVIGADGKEYAVAAMLGANETYDVAKFRVDVKKSAPLSVAADDASMGQNVWVLPYHDSKKLAQGVVRKAEKFAKEYNYYTVSVKHTAEMVGCPLMNEQGLVMGLLQESVKQGDTICYAVSARYADSLKISGLSLNDPALKATNIKKALPATLDQAVLMLYLGSSALDSLGYSMLVEDFIQLYPKVPDGYQYRARLAYRGNNFESARRDMETAVKVAEKKDESHYAYSQLIYQKMLYKKQDYEPWTLATALEEAEKAYSINPLPIYKRQQALVLFSQKQYEKACQLYEELSHTSLRSADMFLEASACKEMLGDTLGRIALLDSAVAMFNKPYLKEAAPYLLLRAEALVSIGKYRDAVVDLNEYERLMKTRVNAQFYYMRYQAELSGRMFQPALNDLDTAIGLQPENDLLYSEKASLLVRVGLYDKAIETAQQLITLSPGQTDGYLFLGLAQCLKGDKKDGLLNLQKAQEMGDTQAADLIKKYAQ